MRHVRMLMSGLALAALPAAAVTARAQAPKAQTSGIWVNNQTDWCAWATVYTGGQIVHQGGFPNWIAPRDSNVYPVQWRGVGQQYRVRVEFKKPKNTANPSAKGFDRCANAGDNPVDGDIETTVFGNLAYKVRVFGAQGSFQIHRYMANGNP